MYSVYGVYCVYVFVAYIVNLCAYVVYDFLCILVILRIYILILTVPLVSPTLLSQVMSKAQEDGQSQAQVIIQTAQHREELRRKGDELDVDIQKGEREILALQLTLDHLNERNTNYKTSLLSMNEQANNISQLKTLESTLSTKKDALFRMRITINRLQSELNEENERILLYQSSIEQNKHTSEIYNMSIIQTDEEMKALYTQINDIQVKYKKRVNKHRAEYAQRHASQSATTTTPATTTAPTADTDTTTADPAVDAEVDALADSISTATLTLEQAEAVGESVPIPSEDSIAATNITPTAASDSARKSSTSASARTVTGTTKPTPAEKALQADMQRDVAQVNLLYMYIIVTPSSK